MSFRERMATSVRAGRPEPDRDHGDERMPGGDGHRPTVRILGTHGVPAAYGGFETAAENVALFLHDRGWRVIVYCQLPGSGPTRTDQWHGIERVLIHEPRGGWLGTSSFDFRSIRHAMSAHQHGDVWLTFGYNTGVFNIVPRLRRIPNVINMDGMEWTRKRWGIVKQGILLANERLAGLVGDVLIGDHPVISRYLRRHFGSRRVQTITYGAHEVETAPTEPVAALDLTPDGYGIVVCRPIPENSVLEIVQAWSRIRRGMPLLVVGPYDTTDPYHRAVRDAASDEVVFPGAIFDAERLQALRFHAAVYLHGHTVGGTNPSLVEAMAAGNAVIAHDNVYNSWVIGEGEFFTTADDLAPVLDSLLHDPEQRAFLGRANRQRFRDEFTWHKIGSEYEHALRTARAKRVPDIAASPQRTGRS
ncbi:DUF1972 domain-containing protein [Microbacterium sp.]|uniref:DUF1972 domain-containing protein n=1 Tax=Microbacterium sp. TaxID=51671 RepID=UPI003A8BA68E